MPPTPYINGSNARELGLKSAEARRQRKAELEQLKNEASPDQLYTVQRVAEVREQIRAFNEKLNQEDDPMRLDRLVNAIYRLTELERVLSGRPLPGQLKPTSRPAPRPDNEPLR